MEKEKKALIPMERTAKQLLNFRRIAPMSGVKTAPIIGMIQQSHAAHGSKSSSSRNIICLLRKRHLSFY